MHKLIHLFGSSASVENFEFELLELSRVLKLHVWLIRVKKCKNLKYFQKTKKKLLKKK